MTYEHRETVERLRRALTEVDPVSAFNAAVEQAIKVAFRSYPDTMPDLQLRAAREEAKRAFALMVWDV